MGRNVKKLEATLKQLEKAQRSLERVDCSVIRRDIADDSREYASELTVKWNTVLCYLEDLIEECHGAIYMEENADETDAENKE